MASGFTLSGGLGLHKLDATPSGQAPLSCTALKTSKLAAALPEGFRSEPKHALRHCQVTFAGSASLP